MTPTISVAQRRARLGHRHLLAARGDGPEAAAEALIALHATDPATVHISAAVRSGHPEVAEAERALYTDRSLLRMLGMRRTVYVVPTGFAPVVQAACADDIAVKQRKLLVSHLAGVAEPALDADPAAWLAEVEEATYGALVARGTATAQELAAAEPRLRQRLVMSRGKPYEATGNITSRVLFLLAASGRIVRGRPRGSWLSTQYHWAVAEDWTPRAPVPDAATARIELARRWLRAYGPATVADLRWWTGWTAGQTTAALAAIGPVEVDLHGMPGIGLPDDLEPETEPAPWVALLPTLDPTPMGWKERDWFLGGNEARLFDRSGNIGPTVWADGRVIGGWGQRTDGEIVHELFEDVGSEIRGAVERAAGDLERWFGEARVTPRFRTPLERSLIS